MIIITHNAYGPFQTIEFPETRSGNTASINFLKTIKKERVSHGWYYKLNEIENLKEKLKEKLKYSRHKNKLELETKLSILEKDRNDLLSILDITCPPPQLKIEIFKK
jgi:hypothetical protein